jgi:hypothetical protein
MVMDSLILFLDTYVIQLYRIVGNPVVDYFLGTFSLALLSVLVGEASVFILRAVNKSHMERLEREMSEKHSLSLQARKSGDKALYRALNREANDAFGKVFFNMFTFSAASLWSAFFVLAWMQYRFIDVRFPLPFRMPLLGESVGYVFTFLLLYVLSRMLVKNLKAWLMPSNCNVMKE